MSSEKDGPIFSDNAPKAVGAYPHARRVGDLIFVSGIGPRHPVTNEIVGGAIRDENGALLDYDIRAQTKQVIENIKSILAEVTGNGKDEQTIRKAHQLINKSQNSNIYIIYVIKVDRHLPLDASVPLSTARGEEILTGIESMIAPLKQINFSLELLQARHIGPAIISNATEKSVDAIVISTKEHTQYGVFSLEEDVLYLLKHSPCQLIVSKT